MKRLSAYMLRLGLGLLVAACAAGDPIEGIQLEEAEEAIIGGTETTGDPAVAALVAFKPGETSGSLCTATLINPTLLLTAAHCVDPAVIGAGMQFEARFHHDIRNMPADKPELRVPVKSVHWNTKFDKNNLPGGNDIAVAVLDRPAPSHIKPIPYAKAALPAGLSGQVRIVGFGLNNGFDTQGTSAGTKREAMTNLGAVTALFVETGGSGQPRICSGDSGGPVLAKINGVETVIGVNSYGFIFCLGSGQSTRVDAYPDFMKEHDKGNDSPDCVPQCTGKACGNDGCGGVCPNTCGAGQVCTPQNTCQPAPQNGCPYETEGNDDVPQANDLCEGDSILGTIAHATDKDWFTFDVKPGTTYTVLLDNVSAKYGFTLYIKSTKTGGLAKVGEGILAGGNRVLSRRTTTGGEYWLHVYGLNGHSSSDTVYGVYVIK
jgi:V8-like Glu-specific endopeptidase